jgi:putative oxidoreductase
MTEAGCLAKRDAFYATGVSQSRRAGMSDAAAAVARLLLALIFVISGFMKLTSIAGFTGYLTRLGVPEPQIMAYVAAVVELVGGLMVLIGFKARWAALVLCVFTGITLYLGHKFWAAPPEQYMNQFNHALKNLAIMGGFLLLFAYGPGRYSADARMSAPRY